MDTVAISIYIYNMLRDHKIGNVWELPKIQGLLHG